MAEATTQERVEALDSPGLEWRNRARGKRVPYWTAARKIARAGYKPTTVRLAEDAAPEELAAACRRLQNEMLAWSGMADKARKVECDGTVAGLIRFYETHPKSVINIAYEPERKMGIKFTTRGLYLDLNKALFKTVGKRRLTALTPDDIWNWYDHFAEPRSEGGKPCIAQAKLVMAQFVRLVKFGLLFKIEGCEELALMLTGARSGDRRDSLGNPFRFPNAEGREGRLTVEDVVAFRDAAAANGKRGSRSMALATILQFETMVRQADI